MTSTAFQLTSPANPESVRVIRAVASGAAADAAMSYDSLDDLDLAVGEASAALLEHSPGTSLECVVAVSPGELEVSVRLHGAQRAERQWPPAGWEESLGAVVLGAVASNLRYDHREGMPAVSFTIS